MEPTPELAAKLDRDRAEAAEAMTFEQRAVAGVAQFDIMAESMRAGIRVQHPDADAAMVEQMLLQRLQEARRFEALD